MIKASVLIVQHGRGTTILGVHLAILIKVALVKVVADLVALAAAVEEQLSFTTMRATKHL